MQPWMPPQGTVLGGAITPSGIIGGSYQGDGFKHENDANTQGQIPKWNLILNKDPVMLPSCV